MAASMLRRGWWRSRTIEMLRLGRCCVDLDLVAGGRGAVGSRSDGSDEFGERVRDAPIHPAIQRRMLSGRAADRLQAALRLTRQTTIQQYNSSTAELDRSANVLRRRSAALDIHTGRSWDRRSRRTRVPSPVV